MRELTLFITILELDFDQQSTNSTGFFKRISASHILVFIKNLVNLEEIEAIDCVEIFTEDRDGVSRRISTHRARSSVISFAISSLEKHDGPSLKKLVYCCICGVFLFSFSQNTDCTETLTAETWHEEQGGRVLGKRCEGKEEE